MEAHEMLATRALRPEHCALLMRASRYQMVRGAFATESDRVCYGPFQSRFPAIYAKWTHALHEKNVRRNGTGGLGANDQKQPKPGGSTRSHRRVVTQDRVAILLDGR